MNMDVVQRKWFRLNKDNDTEVCEGDKLAWNDSTTFQHGYNCMHIQPVTKDRFCQIMDKLQIKRLFFVGDSLTAAQLQSLVSLLGYDAQDFFATPRVPIKRNTIDCIIGNAVTSISVESYRENLGSNLHQANVTGREDATLKTGSNLD